jgi:pimeloyl-ACP methyl ester carboxylesterase
MADPDLAGVDLPALDAIAPGFPPDLFGRHRRAAPGWWNELAGPGRALDSERFRVLGIDFLGGSHDSSGPAQGERFPSVSSYDQASILRRVLDHLSVVELAACIGASYGGMVSLAFAEVFPDPLRQAVPEAVAEARAAGVRVVMMTGDHAGTARAIAAQAGIAIRAGVVSGRGLEGWADSTLAREVQCGSVAARVPCPPGSASTPTPDTVEWIRVSASAAKATWVMARVASPRKKSRSPGRLSAGATGLPMPAWSAASRGSTVPRAAKVVCTKPDQSTPQGVTPPHS